MKKIFLTILTLSMLLPLTGCWDYREIKEQMIVAGISVDKAEDGAMLVNFEMLHMPSSHDESIKPIVISSTGATLEDAIYNATEKVAYFPYVGHSWLLLVSEEYAREGIDKLIETLVHEPNFYMSTYIAVVKEASAYEIFDCMETTGTIMSYDLINGLESDQKFVYKTNALYAYEIYSIMQSPSNSYILPVIELQTENDEATTGEEGNGGTAGEEGNSNNGGNSEQSGSAFAVVNGGAVFVDGQYIDFLSEEEVQCYQIVTAQASSGILVVSTEDKDYSLKITNNHSSIEVDASGDVPSVQLHVKLDISSGSNPGTKTDGIQYAAEEKLKEQIDLLLEKIVSQRSDIFEIATKLRRYDAEAWKQTEENWDSMLDQIVYDVVIEITVID